VVHVNALNRSTKTVTVTLTTNYTFDVAVYYSCMNCEIGLKLRLNEILRCHLLNDYELRSYFMTNVHRR